MIRTIFATRNDVALTLARVTLGVVMFAHGAQKMLGWFGGYGFSGTMGFFTQQMHIPAPLAFLAICAEFFGGLGLIAGLLGRVAAFGVTVNMIVAALLVHLPNGFFMNWSGTAKGEGFEYHLLAIALGLAVAIDGSGAFSIDRLVAGVLAKGSHSDAGQTSERDQAGETVSVDRGGSLSGSRAHGGRARSSGRSAA